MLLGVLLFSGYAFQTWGLVTTTPSKSAFITGFSVILVPLISLFQGYRMRLANAGGATLGMLGLYFLVLPSGIAGVNRGDVLTLFGAIAFAIHIVAGGIYSGAIPSSIWRRVNPDCGDHRDAHGSLGSGGNSGHPLDRPLGARHSGHSHFRHGLCLQRASLGAAIHSARSYRFDFRPGTRFAALASRLFLNEHLGGKVLLGSLLILAGMMISEVWGGTLPAPVEG